MAKSSSSTTLRFLLICALLAIFCSAIQCAFVGGMGAGDIYGEGDYDARRGGVGAGGARAVGMGAGGLGGYGESGGGAGRMGAGGQGDYGAGGFGARAGGLGDEQGGGGQGDDGPGGGGQGDDGPGGGGVGSCYKKRKYVPFSSWCCPSVMQNSRFSRKQQPTCYRFKTKCMKFCAVH